MTSRIQRGIIFGIDRDPGVFEEVVTKGGARSKSGTLKSNPLVPVFGPGPEGATCKTCVHLYRQHGGARYFLKCELRRVSHSAATDHRSGWQACGRYELAVAPDHPE